MNEVGNFFNTKEERFLVGTLVIAATVFAIYNHYYSIKLNKLRIEREANG
jgi:hypothetical protein